MSNKGTWRYIKQVNQFFRLEEMREGREPRIVAILHNETDAKRIVAAVNATPWAPPKPKSANGFSIGDRVRLKEPQGPDRLMVVEDCDWVIGDEHKVKVWWKDLMTEKRMSETYKPDELRKVVVQQQH